MVDTYRTRDVADLLGIAPARVRRLVRAGLPDACRDARGYRFSFQDLVLIRTAAELEASAVPLGEVSRALRALRHQLPDRPLSSVRVSSQGRRVVVREGDAAWEPVSGQLVLGIGEAEPRPGGSNARRLRAGDGGPGGAGSPREGPRPVADAREWFEAGCRLEADDPAEARQAYLRALELEPEHSEAHLNLGRMLHEDGSLDEAESHYRAALAAQPQSATAAFNLGVVLEDLGKIEPAIEAYLLAVASDPDFADAHYNLSRLYESRGERSAALRHLRSFRLYSQTR